MKISVIVLSYKPQAYLWQCLSSICNQTFPKEEYELILVLNGCNEPYNGQIKEYISKYQEVNWNYIQTDVSGVSNARNVALNAAKGIYVTFIDDDDFVSPTYLQSLYEAADEQTVVLCCPYAFFGDDVNNRTPYFTHVYDELHDKGDVTPSKVRKFFSGPWMKLFT